MIQALNPKKKLKDFRYIPTNFQLKKIQLLKKIILMILSLNSIMKIQKGFKCYQKKLDLDLNNKIIFLK